MISRRAYAAETEAYSWEEIWEAGPYYDRISELLEDATSHAIFVGWQIDSRLPMKKPSRPHKHLGGFETLKEKIIRLCTEKPSLHFYFLMWDHAYFYVFEREIMQGRIWDDLHERVHFVFDNKHPFGASHHEKLILIDGRIAFCGGIDLCADRWDTPFHHYHDQRRSLDLHNEQHGPYHDLAVQVTGPVCTHIHNHIKKRWCATSKLPFPPALKTEKPTESAHKILISRTISSVDAGETGTPITREIEFLCKDLINAAEHSLIIEGQYYWSAAFNNWLIEKMEKMQGTGFRIFLIVTDLTGIKSLTRHMIYYELQQLIRLQKAAKRTKTRLILGTPQVMANSSAEGRKEKPRPMYVHSKLLVVDDKYLSIGSANIATRAFRFDSELNLTLVGASKQEQNHIRRFSQKVLQHWNIDNIQQQPNVRLRRIHAATELLRLRKKRPIISRIPWQKCFDPQIPLTFLIKRRYRILEHRSPARAFLAAAILVLLNVLVSRLILHTENTAQLAYLTILSTVWFIPIPFTAIVSIAVLHMGHSFAASAAAVSLWSAGLFGYLAVRAFPTSANRLLRGTAPAWLPYKLGARNFPCLVSIIIDPRISIRAKIAFQALAYTPFPWFALITFLVLPGIFSILSFTLNNIAPNSWKEAAAHYGIFLTLTASLASMLHFFVHSITNSAQRKALHDQKAGSTEHWPDDELLPAVDRENKYDPISKRASN